MFRANSSHKRSGDVESKRRREVVEYVRMTAIEGNLKAVDGAGYKSRGG